MSLRSLRSIVARQPPAIAEKSATVLEAAILMKQQGKGALLVVEGPRLTGIFTERDALDDDLYELRVDLVQRADERD